MGVIRSCVGLSGFLFFGGGVGGGGGGGGAGGGGVQRTFVGRNIYGAAGFRTTKPYTLCLAGCLWFLIDTWGGYIGVI